jgi:transcriptional regulator with XRE-family HTH domain
MNNLRALRDSKGLSTRELGDVVGVSYASISDWENGKTEPKPKNRKRLCEVFECDITDIFPEIIESYVQVVLKATFSGDLKIGDINIPCHVLDNGQRVISGRGMQSALKLDTRLDGTKFSQSGKGLTRFFNSERLKPFIFKEGDLGILQPIKFRYKNFIAFGYEATILADICDAILEARKSGIQLTEKQIFIAEQCEILVRTFAKIGLIALVDEATGYQEVRDRNALNKILEAYIAKELLPWTKRFPDEFYKEMFRLKNWPYPKASTKRPGIVGHYTTDIVYDRLPDGIRAELEEKNPLIVSKSGKKYRRNKHFQYLTEQIGNPHLEKHLAGTVALMRASGDWETFKRLLERAYPKSSGQQLEIAPNAELNLKIE